MFNKSKKKNLALPTAEVNDKETSNLNRRVSVRKNISKSFNNLVSGIRKSIIKTKTNQLGGKEFQKLNKNSNSLSNISSDSIFKNQSTHDRNTGSNTPNQSIKSYKRTLKNVSSKLVF